MQALVIVSGPPGSGKTTIGRALAEALGWPYIEKDAIKESLFESLGVGDEDWSLRLSKASFAVMFAVAAELERAILEGNFGPDQREAIRAVHPAPMEIFCWCDREELLRRIRNRTRHPGHVDEETLRRVAAGVPSEKPLELGGPYLELDTTKPVDAQRVAAWVEEKTAT